MPGFRGDIEGLRAVAVALVVLDHAGVGPFDGGYVGVDVFFVISGFLITRLLVSETDHRERPSVLRFYARRARRILPLAALVTVSTVVASYAYLGTSLGNRTADDAWWVGLFAGNLRFAREGVDYFAGAGPTSPLEHFWSLGVEEQFYVGWPLVVAGVALVAGSALVRRRVLGLVLVLVVLGSVALSVHQTGTQPTLAYFSPLTRAHELGSGALVAVLLHRRRELPVRLVRLGGAATVAGLALVVGPALAYGPQTLFPGWRVLVPVAGACLVVLGGALAPDATASGTLASAPLRYVGRRSYGLYLWHWPLLVLPAVRLGETPSPQVRALLVLAAFVLADVTFRLVEDPVRRARTLRRRSPALSLGLGGLLVALVLGTAQGARALHRVPPAVAEAAAAAATPSPLPERPDGPALAEAVETAVSAVDLDATVPADVQPPVDAIAELGSPQPDETVCDRTYDATDADACEVRPGGDPSAGTVLLWGDSHAGMWVPALMDVTAQTGQRLVALTKYGCPPLLDTPSWHPEEDRPYDECAAYTTSALATVRAEAPAVVVLTGAFLAWRPVAGGEPQQGGSPDNDDAWDAGLTRTIRAVQATGARVVVLGDIAAQAKDPTVCVAVHDRIGDCTTPRSEAVGEQHLADEEAATTAAGAAHVSTVDWMCSPAPDGQCPSVIDDTVVYRDAFHVTRQWSHLVAQALGTAAGLLAP